MTARLPPDKEAEFVNAPWTESLEGDGKIPNVAAATIACLASKNIKSQYHLVGKFLACKEKGDNTQQRCDKFVAFLDECGVNKSLQSVITYAMAKKLDRTFPGFFVATECVSGEDEE